MLLSTESCLLLACGEMSGKAAPWRFQKYVKIHHRRDPFVAVALPPAGRCGKADAAGLGGLRGRPRRGLTPVPIAARHGRHRGDGFAGSLSFQGPGSGRRWAACGHRRFVWLLRHPPARTVLVLLLSGDKPGGKRDFNVGSEHSHYSVTSLHL